MAEVLEVVITFLVIAIYGSEDRPSHPIWRNTIRAIGFGGAAVSIAIMLGLLGDIEIPLVIVAIWVTCTLIIVSAEYYVGSKKVCYAMLATSVIWFLIAFTKSDIL